MSWPTILENVLLIAVNFISTMMVSHMGKVATAAVGVNSSPMWVLNGAIQAIGTGATVLVAQSVGARDERRAQQVARQSLVLGLAAGLLFMLLAQAVAGALPGFMRADRAVWPDATLYMRIISLAFIPHFAGIVMAGVLRGAGDMRTPLRANLIVNALNVAGSLLLIYPTRRETLFGFMFPVWGAGLGVAGAGLSVAISTASALLILLRAMTRPGCRLPLVRGASYRVTGEVLRKILRVGLPAALERMAVNSGQVVFQRAVSGLGTEAFAAHQLATQAESLSYMPAYGFQAAATTLVGQAMGADRPEEAARDARATFLLALGTMTVMGIVLFAFPEALLSVFGPEPAVLALGAPALRIEACAQPFFAAAIVLSGALRGAGDTRAPLIISLISMWLVRIVLTFVFINALGMGLSGAWLAMATELGVRGLAMFVRYARGKWKRVHVER